MAINEERSYTEYNVISPTTDFVVGFEFLDDGIDIVEVTLDNVDPTTIGYTVLQVNNTTYRFAPAVTSGVVRLTRVTDIDNMAHVFTEGAIFISENMDGNFKQIRHAQQEVRDSFKKLELEVDAAVVVSNNASELALEASVLANSASALATQASNDVIDTNTIVQTSGEVNVTLSDGSVVPNMNKRIADYGNKVLSVNGEVGVVSITDTDIPSGSYQKQSDINMYGGRKYDMPVGGYPINAKVLLANGDIVKSTVPNNIINPNVDMTGWVYDNLKKYRPDVIAENPQIRGDGAVNDSSALQVVATKADIELKNHMEFSTLNNNYLLDEAVVIQEPMMLLGDAAPTYNRGDGKKGKIVIGTTDHAFDLGNYRTRGTAPFVFDVENKRTKNPADQWTIKNLAFIQKTGQPSKSKTALLHTSRTNGPDRGVALKEVSGSGLKHLFKCVNSDSETQIATFSADNVCASENELPFKFDGATNGGVVTSCQVEQNTVGAFHGYMNGAWFFKGNMLEGQPNAIKVEVPPVTGNRTMLVAHGNYFEANSGDYVAEIKNSASGGAVDFAYNWSLNMTAKDYILVNESAPIQVYNKDARPVTFKGQNVAEYGSDFLSYRVKHWIQRDFNATSKMGAFVLIEKFLNLHNPKSTATQANKLSSALIETPVGKIRAAQNSEFLTIPISVATNDVVQVNMFAYIDSIDPTVQVYNSTTTVALAQAAANITSASKRWALVSFSFKATEATTAIRVRLYSTTNDNRILAAASASVLSVRADLGYDVYPELPILNIEQVGKNYSATFNLSIPEIATGATYQTTVSDANFLTDDHILASIAQTNSNYFVTAWVSSAGQIYIRFTSTGAIVSARTVDVKIKAFRD